MDQYITIVARDLLKRFGGDLSRVAVVFPNKRASLFMNRELARLAGRDIWSPAYLTISDLFRRHSTLTVADQILLVCKLYDVFVRETGYAGETLDRFFNWGVMLLADFDDIDKNMADAGKVFSVVTDLHELDDISYLDEKQTEALKHFFAAFTDTKPSEMREKFMRLWGRLHSIYMTFREELRRDGIAYEGMLYRDVAEDKTKTFAYDTYCFVGFNMLHAVEQRLFAELRDMDRPEGSLQPRALFYWDYDTYYMKPSHEAGHFISSYTTLFPDALASLGDDVHGNFRKADITCVSSSTENLQARYVSDWLLENDRWKDGPRTAIVMADETLLQTIIRSLPEEVKAVNITTGYPLSQSPAVSLLQYLIDMQTAGSVTGTETYRLRHVLSVLRHPYIAGLSDAVTELTERIAGEHNYYPSRAELSVNDDLALLFADLSCPSEPFPPASFNARLLLWTERVLMLAARTASALSPLDRESLFRLYQVTERLCTLVMDNTLTVDTTTLNRLLTQITDTATVPYHGEPIEGIQIMGVLETRCLDFDHVLLLSCNEGNMPKGVNDSSFIPHSVRQAHSLTTVEHKVGIYSYYFHRLLQRAGDVTLAYNSSTEGMNTGEMSRFMLQLMVESGRTVRRLTLTTGQTTTMSAPHAVVKDEIVMKQLEDLITSRRISPTSLGTYLRCQVKYYYQHVAHLREQDNDDADEIDNRTFGDIFHAAAENIYNAISTPDGTVTREAIDRTLKDKSFLGRCVDDAFMTELFHIDAGQPGQGKGGAVKKMPRYSGLQIINRKVILHFLGNMLRYDRNTAPFKIIGTEREVSREFDFDINGTKRTMKFGGYIDRLDMAQGRIRIIDYKTGNRQQEPLNSVSDIFNPENIGRHTDYYLQTLLYSLIVSEDKEICRDGRKVMPLLYFVQKMGAETFSPSLFVNGGEIEDVRDVKDEYLKGIQELLTDIMNPHLRFEPTSDATRCTSCSLRQICQM